MIPAGRSHTNELHPQNACIDNNDVNACKIGTRKGGSSITYAGSALNSNNLVHELEENLARPATSLHDAALQEVSTACDFPTIKTVLMMRETSAWACLLIAGSRGLGCRDKTLFNSNSAAPPMTELIVSKYVIL